jgi:hypothetical protein
VAVKKQKLTPWFPISTPPVRPGVYQVETEYGLNLPWLCEYRGGQWLGTVSGQRTADEASEIGRRIGPTSCELTQWRGLAKEPK